MKTPAAPVLWMVALAGLGLPGLRANERVIMRDFSVGEAPRLTLHAYRGAVRVTAADTKAIHIEAHVSTGPLDAAGFERAFQRFHFQARSDGRHVDVVATGPHVQFLWQEKDDLQIIYQVVVPRRCAVDVENESGSVNVGDLDASVTVHTRRGTVYLKHIAGDIDASTTATSLVVSHCDGSARLHNESGDIRIGPVAGTLVATTVSGDIDVQLARGAATLSADSGDISLGLPKQVGGPISARTQSGQILLRLNPAARCTLDATSVWGHVRFADLPLQVLAGGNNRGRLEATLDGGGPRVILHADGGHVDIKPSRT